jgi:hypothetical protein
MSIHHQRGLGSKYSAVDITTPPTSYPSHPLRKSTVQHGDGPTPERYVWPHPIPSSALETHRSLAPTEAGWISVESDARTLTPRGELGAPSAAQQRVQRQTCGCYSEAGSTTPLTMFLTTSGKSPLQSFPIVWFAMTRLIVCSKPTTSSKRSWSICI